MKHEIVSDVGSDFERDLSRYRKRARAWISEHLQPRTEQSQSRDVGYYTPEVMAANRTLQRLLFEGGYAGIDWPKEYGGQGLPNMYEEAFLEEAADYVLPDFGHLSTTTFSVCVPTMLAHAAPSFLRGFVPKVLAGDALVCQFFSEPAAGSDLAGVRTRVTRDGDNWVLNGSKIWSTYAQLADWGMCLARSDWQAPKHRGLTWFVVACNSPGLAIRPIRQINETSEYCEEFFDDVVVPDANRIGDVNGGWAIAQTLLVFERGAGHRLRNGIDRPGSLAPDLLALAQKAGRASDPVIRQKLARAHTNDFVGKALEARLAQLSSLGRMSPGEAAYGKLFLGTYNPTRARLAVEIGGPAAMTWSATDAQGPATSLYYLNGRIPSIAGGTNEVQRNAIGERVLGLPREPSFDTTKPFSEVIRDAKNWTGKV